MRVYGEHYPRYVVEYRPYHLNSLGDLTDEISVRWYQVGQCGHTEEAEAAQVAQNALELDIVAQVRLSSQVLVEADEKTGGEGD